MAVLYITQFSAIGEEAKGKNVIAALAPEISTQAMTFTTSTASSAFEARTRYVRIYSDSACHITFGSSPTATTNDMKLAADAPEYFAVYGAIKVAAVTAA